jgi:predicted transcriptional regulator
MLFFRKIRRLLLAENKFSRYLIYASGEIVLVVIGILLALQINNWKIASDNRKIVRNTLIKIKKNLQDDVVNLQETAKFKINQKEACDRIIGFFVNPSVPVKDTLQFENDIMLTRYFILPSYNETAFEMAKTNGYLNIFTNDSLVEQLAKYYSDNTLDQHVTDTKRYTNSIEESVFEKKYMLNSWNTVIFDGAGGSYKFEWYKNDMRALFQIDTFRRDIQVENYYTSLYARLTIGINYLKNKAKLAEQLIEKVDINIENLK